MFGFNAFGVTTYADIPDDQKEFVADTDDIILAPDSVYRFLLEAKYYDGAEKTFYASSHSFSTDSGDTPANQFYVPVLINPYSFNAAMFSADGINSGAVPTVGDIVLLNADGELDDLIEHAWDGRELVIKIGLEDFSYSQYLTIFRGTTQEIEWDEDNITLTLGSLSGKLETEIQQNAYTGQGLVNGEYTGYGQIAGRLKPLVYGDVVNYAPLLIDPFDLVYQIHDGRIHDFAVPFVRDNGSSLFSEGDTTDLPNANPSPGAYITDVSRGLIKLGDKPAGKITMDTFGDSITGSDFILSTGEIVDRILRRHFDFQDGDINTTKINELNNDEPATVGIVLNGQETGTQVLNELMSKCGGWWTFDRLGVFSASVLKLPFGPLRTISNPDLTQNPIVRTDAGRVIWRQRIGVTRRWSIQSEDELSDSLGADAKAFYSREHDYNVNEDASIKTKHLLARQVTFDTLFKSDFFPTPTLIQRYLDIFGVRRSIYRLDLTWGMFLFELGDTITLQIDRFGLDAGKEFRVISINEDAASDTTQIEVWG